MIKKLLICTITLFSVGLIYGQSIKADKRLEVKFTKAELVELEKNDPTQLDFLNFCIDNAYTLMDLPEEKRNSEEIRGTIQLDNLTAINFFELGLEIEELNWQYYIIEGTQKLFVVYSKDFLLNYIKK